MCAGLSPLGIELDSSRNATASSVAAAAGGVAGVHSNFSRARVLVVRANEEGEIARQATHAAGVRHAERPAAAPSVAAQALPAQGQKVGQVYLAPLTPRAGTASAAMGAPLRPTPRPCLHATSTRRRHVRTLRKEICPREHVNAI